MNKIASAFAFLLVAALHGQAAAASFDCNKASAPIEQAICTDAALSLADFVLAERYQHLTAHCTAQPEAAEQPAMQRRWLAQTRAAFVSGEAGLVDLRSRYQQRNEELLRALDACSLQRPLAPLRVATVSHAGSSLKLPWVEAPSPEISRRINDAVFSQVLDGPAPARLRDAVAALAAGPAQGPGIREAEFSVRRNDGRPSGDRDQRRGLRQLLRARHHAAAVRCSQRQGTGERDPLHRRRAQDADAALQRHPRRPRPRAGGARQARAQRRGRRAGDVPGLHPGLDGRIQLHAHASAGRARRLATARRALQSTCCAALGSARQHRCADASRPAQCPPEPLWQEPAAGPGRCPRPRTAPAAMRAQRTAAAAAERAHPRPGPGV